jgi:nucleotide-binding universal stress UspA family protein
MANAIRRRRGAGFRLVSTDLIISYDGTPNDDDALALGKLLAGAGASMALAYIRHSREFDPAREELAQHDAERRLEHGASWLGDPSIPQHVVFSGSTGEGLEALAEAENASIIVFGSDYRTSPGHAEPGTSAQRLLDGSPIAIAVAAAGLRTVADPVIASIAVASTAIASVDGESSAQQTADVLAGKLGAKLVEFGEPAADLIVVGSQPTSTAGRITLGGSTRALLNTARGSVLVVPSGAPVQL